jgi:hypothetical protein
VLCRKETIDDFVIRAVVVVFVAVIVTVVVNNGIVDESFLLF